MGLLLFCDALICISMVTPYLMFLISTTGQIPDDEEEMKAGRLGKTYIEL